MGVRGARRPSSSRLAAEPGKQCQERGKYGFDERGGRAGSRGQGSSGSVEVDDPAVDAGAGRVGGD
jgi:hypothetical protein